MQCSVFCEPAPSLIRVDDETTACSEGANANANANAIDGGSGADMLTGKAGKGMFVFADAPNSGVDTIIDMNQLRRTLIRPAAIDPDFPGV